MQKLFQFYDTNRNTAPSKLIDSFKDDEILCACVSELSATCENLVDKDKSLQDCVQWIRQKSLKLKLKDLCEDIKEAQFKGDDTGVVGLVMKYNEMLKSAK